MKSRKILSILTSNAKAEAPWSGATGKAVTQNGFCEQKRSVGSNGLCHTADLPRKPSGLMTPSP
jgi:hypothetical protein